MDSEVTDNQEGKNGPYDPDALRGMAEQLADDLNISPKWREDAVAEFIAAAFEAGFAENRGIRAYQYDRGRGAMLDFLKRETSMEARSPGRCKTTAKRVSLDMPVAGMDGEPTTLAEIVRDHNMSAPDAGLVAEDLKEAVARAMSRLKPEEAEAVRRVCIEGQTQTEAATAMGLTPKQIRNRLGAGKNILRIWLADYRTAPL